MHIGIKELEMSEHQRVLVVHRHGAVINEIKQHFKNAGWFVHLAHSGLDGLQAARRESFALIITAADLPVITGIEMIRAVRNFSFNVETPVVFVEMDNEENYGLILEKINATVYSIEKSGWSQLTNIVTHKNEKKKII